MTTPEPLSDDTKTALQVAAGYVRKLGREIEDTGLCFTMERGTHVNDIAARRAAGYLEAAQLILALTETATPA